LIESLWVKLIFLAEGIIALLVYSGDSMNKKDIKLFEEMFPERRQDKNLRGKFLKFFYGLPEDEKQFIREYKPRRIVEARL
jgi:hypothetical protein